MFHQFGNNARIMGRLTIMGGFTGFQCAGLSADGTKDRGI
jgi:hypothetical protein